MITYHSGVYTVRYGEFVRSFLTKRMAENFVNFIKRQGYRNKFNRM